MTKNFLKSVILTIGWLLMVLPVQAQHIAAGRIHSLFLDPDGNVWVWGGPASKVQPMNEYLNWP